MYFIDAIFVGAVSASLTMTVIVLAITPTKEKLAVTGLSGLAMWVVYMAAVIVLAERIYGGYIPHSSWAIFIAGGGAFVHFAIFGACFGLVSTTKKNGTTPTSS